MTRTTSTATVATDRPGRYGKQLVNHLGRHQGGEWSEESDSGWIVLGAGRTEVTCAEGALELRLDGDADEMAGLEDVVGRHLVRFGAKDELVVRWVRADSTPGTEQGAGAAPAD
ncbi:DUF2218 domain-containing protein [Spongiactinospora sp. 9N601]|uniref:DUF2218 domain-containing protein n=1 Tax=Spongiactinospora sp. 9N601 TaxID=3375149 RepID=UPI0037899A48